MRFSMISAIGLVVLSTSCTGKTKKGPQSPGRSDAPTSGRSEVYRAAPDPCASQAGGTFKYDFDWKGQKSPTVLVLPEGKGPRDLVVLLHGGGSASSKILNKTRFENEALAEGFALLVPNGVDLDNKGNRWNSGKFDADAASDDLRDDVGYLDALVAQAKRDLCVGEVLASGFSNGGQMSQRWACQGTQVDAVLTASGTLLVDPATCRKPVAIQGWTGTEDRVFDAPPMPGTNQPSAQKSLELWAEVNQCSNPGNPTESRTGEVVCRTWSGCAVHTELCIIDDQPHGWPSPWAKNACTTNVTAKGWDWFESL